MNESTITVPSLDGIDLETYRWAPEGRPNGIVQIQHGLGEHAGRYRRFGEALTRAGYLVYAPDARGSGRTARGDYGRWGSDGWPGWVEDLNQLNRRIRADHPDTRLALVGHSLGSFASQEYLLDHSADVDAVVLIGTTEPGGIADMLGGDEPADLSGFNAGFEHRTGFEWLTRDEAEVDAYCADPGCGFASEPFVGIESLRRAADPGQIARIRADLPILILSGADDPIAEGGAAPELVGRRYRDAGLTDVEVGVYPQARHELLNETNRDEVTARIVAFLDRTIGR